MLLVAVGFNPRTRVGCELRFLLSKFCPYQFQSTHPCGVRIEDVIKVRSFTEVSIHAPVWGANRHRTGRGRRTARFNPRTRVGCEYTNLM